MKLKRFTTQLVAAGLIAVPLMAHAAGLGKLSVTSALGQPLAAEIELFAADKAELDSLSASLASDQAFRDARVEFAPVLSSLRFTVEKKPNGKAVLKVTSARPVNDPFIDMLVELNWASGRLVREYTMLLDPPGMGGVQTVAPVAVAPAQVIKPVPAAAPQAEATPAPAVAHKPAPAPQAAVPDRVTVKRGDTLTGIADRVRPESVSLEQILLGLYRENTQAFDGNMNRLKAGKTLNVPSAEKVAAIPQQEAVRELKLQADDWRAYRQKLAAAVSAAPEAKTAPAQASSGKITPKVEDRAKPAPAAQQDVLKLSKVTPPAAAAAGKADEARALQEKLRAQEEDATARENALKESDQRVAMLETQIQDMQKLVEMKEKAQAEAPVAAPAPAASAPASVAPVVVAPPASPEPADNWYDPLLANPLYWGGGLAALGLGGVLWWMMAGGGRRRKAGGTSLDDSIMTGGDVRPNTVLGAASGGSVNTGDTSFLTDFSQAGLGTIDTHDVDPIAEAEVYMAYGRDAQAEEILKEAINKTPDRHEIRVKLLEIYAARRNTVTFEAVAGELYAALGSKSSPLWDKACELGRSIDPTNPLYGGVQTSAAPAAAVATVAATAAVAGGAVTFTDEPEPKPMAGMQPAVPVEIEAAPEPEPELDVVTANAPLEFESAGHVLNFDTQPEAVVAPEAGYVERDTLGLDFDLPDLDLPATADDTLKLDLGLDEDNGPDSKFDFSGLDLDLGEVSGDELELDEVGTKLDLARAYVEMGDKEGAREILNEVLAEGSDKQKSDAKGMLSSLG
ncbi:MAG TPA: FimV/HubP family polar landmark protein [Thiobacillus sp.]|nr:FimV/HubP family polar landmark protein [Thiobacillus sp.]